MMADQQSLRDRAVNKLPSQTMCENVFAMVSATSDYAVFTRSWSLPQNAASLIWTAKVLLKSYSNRLSCWSGTCFKVAARTAKISVSERDLGSFFEKTCTAFRANANGFAVGDPALASAEMHSSARSHQAAIPGEHRFAICALKLDFVRLAVSHGASFAGSMIRAVSMRSTLVRLAYFTT